MSQIKPLDPIKTVLTITVGFIVVFLVTKVQAWLVASLAIGLIGVFSAYLSQKINYIWMKLTLVLSLIVPNILLSLIFYLFLFPLAILSKIFGKKNNLKLKNVNGSMFETRKKVFDKESFENIW